MRLKDILGSTIKFVIVAKSIGEVIEHLDNYEYTKDSNYILLAAWIARVGILDIIEKYNYRMDTTVRTIIHGERHKMILNEGYLRSIGRIYSKSKEFSERDRKDIEGILDKEDVFYTIDKTIPYEVKKKYI